MRITDVEAIVLRQPTLNEGIADGTLLTASSRTALYQRMPELAGDFTGIHSKLMTLVDQEAQIMLITTTGVLIRTRVSEIREMGRATQGVTLISLDEGTKLSGLQQVAEAEADVDVEADVEGPAEGDNGGENGDAV